MVLRLPGLLQTKVPVSDLDCDKTREAAGDAISETLRILFFNCSPMARSHALAVVRELVSRPLSTRSLSARSIVRTSDLKRSPLNRFLAHNERPERPEAPVLRPPFLPR